MTSSNSPSRLVILLGEYQDLVAAKVRVQMDQELDRWADAAQIVRARRESLGWSLTRLSTLMSGYPNPTRIAKIERGEIRPTAPVAKKLADALGLPSDIVLQIFGWATPEQIRAAHEAAERLVKAQA